MDKSILKLIEQKNSEYDSLAYNMYLRSNGVAAKSYTWEDPRKANGVPILARKKISSSDANIRINHDLFSLIQKEKAGYFATSIARDYAEDVPEQVREKYTQFDRVNSTKKLFKNIATSCAGWGNTYALCYLSEDRKQVLIEEVPAWSCMVVNNSDYGTPTDGYIYETAEKWTYVWHYTKTTVTKYLVKNNSITVVEDEAPHGFQVMPLIEFRNDETRQGNAERAISLIDAYDLMVSDNATEQAAFRNAYLLLSNLGVIDEDTKKNMQKTGVIVGDGDNAKAEFITKNINPEFAKLVMDVVWQNIFVVSSTVDTKALTSLSNATAFQISQIYRNLENDCKNTELEWQDSMEILDQVLYSFWRFLDTPTVPEYNTLGINYEFKRNMPKDVISDLEGVRRAGGILPNWNILKRALNIDEERARELAEEAAEDMTAAMPEI